MIMQQNFNLIPNRAYFRPFHAQFNTQIIPRLADSKKNTVSHKINTMQSALIENKDILSRLRAEALRNLQIEYQREQPASKNLHYTHNSLYSPNSIDHVTEKLEATSSKSKTQASSPQKTKQTQVDLEFRKRSQTIETEVKLPSIHSTSLQRKASISSIRITRRNTLRLPTNLEELIDIVFDTENEGNGLTKQSPTGSAESFEPDTLPKPIMESKTKALTESNDPQPNSSPQPQAKPKPQIKLQLKSNHWGKKRKPINLRAVLWAVLAAQWLISGGKHRRATLQERSQSITKQIDYFSLKIGRKQSFHEVQTWAKTVCGKISAVMMAQSFYSQYVRSFNPTDAYVIDQRKQYLRNFLTFLYTSLELSTRKENISDNVKYRLCMALFESQQVKPSFYVSQRVNYISSEHPTIKEAHKRLIIAEQTFYSIIIENMFGIGNELEYKNVHHASECKVYFTSIASYIQADFKSEFQKLPLIRSYKGECLQKNLVIQPDLKMVIQLEKRMDPQQQILSGLLNEELFEKIFAGRENLRENLRGLFKKIIQNLCQSTEF